MIFDDIFDEKLILMLPEELADGKVGYREEEVAGCLIEGWEKDREESVELLRNGITALVRGPVVLPPGCKIRVGGKVYEPKAVKMCRSLDGSVMVSRCILE